MNMRKLVEALVIMFLFLRSSLILIKAAGREGLSVDFYEQSCPQVEEIVRTGLQSISLSDPTTPAAMLRLMFHDCQVQGCDASILLDPENGTQQSEMSTVKSFGIRKRYSINLIKSIVELACPEEVSCADILILAAREAVAMSGGPRIEVPLGRRDSSSPPSFKLADSLLPSANTGVDGLLRLFATKGMTIEESVAIIGAHTLGVTHCFTLRKYRTGSGQVNGEIQPGLEILINMRCPFESKLAPFLNASFLENDPTSLSFDNQYFNNAINGFGVLRIDAEMPLDPRTAPFVQQFAADESQFFQAFSSAFVKLSVSNVLVGRQGVVRRNCNSLN